MHEHHIVEGIVKQAIEQAGKNRAKKVTGVIISLEELSGYKEDSVRFYFEDLSRGTILEGAKLTVKSLAAKLKCQACGIVFEHKKGEFNCPQCRGQGIPAGPDRGLSIESIEIDA